MKKQSDQQMTKRMINSMTSREQHLLFCLAAGNCGISVDLPAPTSAASQDLAPFAALFSEELGLVLEVHPGKAALVSSLFNQAGVSCSIIGKVTPSQSVDIRVAGQTAVSGNTAALRDIWEETSFALERLQAAEECVDEEQRGLKSRTAPKWVLPFVPSFTAADKMSSTDKVRNWLALLLTRGFILLSHSNGMLLRVCPTR